jgi:hypothetical protein
MGPLPRSLAAQAHGCFRVRIPGWIQPNTRSRREARAPGRAPLGQSGTTLPERKQPPRREGMSGPMSGPDRTMMRDAMRQEGSTHPGR